MILLNDVLKRKLFTASVTDRKIFLYGNSLDIVKSSYHDKRKTKQQIAN